MRLRLLILSVVLTAAPAHAHTSPNATEVTYSGALPCTVVCSYWVDNGFTPCEAPFPPGSFVDHVTSPAPTPPSGKILVLEATLDNEVDWDLFLCSNTTPPRELGYMTPILGEPCDNRLGSNHILPIGCHEDTSTPVVAGQTVIMRAYNWSDPLPATGRYWFLAI